MGERTAPSGSGLAMRGFGNHAGMSPWTLLAIPLCLGLVAALLFVVSWFEDRVLSPRSLILYTARSRRMGPDTVELFVSKESERLLTGRHGR